MKKKARFRELHTLHEERGFPAAPLPGKLLVNMSSFGSRMALRSPHLWLLEQEIQEVRGTVLEKKRRLIPALPRRLT